MTTLKTMLLNVSAAAVLAAGGLHAQTKTTANIPFEFAAQNTTLPAGEYSMSKASAAGGVLLIRNTETNKAVMVLAPDSGYRSPREENVVVFHRIGDRYFLSEVKTNAVHGQIAPAKLERELTADAGGRPVAAVIVAALNVR